jgi:hypothetical protein
VTTRTPLSSRRDGAAEAGDLVLRSSGQASRDRRYVAPLLPGVAESERQADIRRRLEFDAAMRAVAGYGVGRVVGGNEGVTEAGVVFHGVETAIDPKRRRARLILEIVAELHALVRADIAERATPAEAVDAETHPGTDNAACTADEPALLQIGARGKAVASAAVEVEVRKVAVSVQALDAVQIPAEAERPARDPVAQGRDLGMRRRPAQAERQQPDYET